MSGITALINDTRESLARMGVAPGDARQSSASTNVHPT